MKAIQEGFTWLINFLKDLYEFLMTMISGLILAFKYLFKMMQMALDIILDLPDWLQAFGIITISITVMYFVIGRNAGKTE